MKLNTTSPLSACALPDNGQLTPHQTIGLVTDLAMHHSDYRDLSVKELLDRLLPALNAGHANLFFDDASRPYGYASWALVSDERHQSLMAGTGQAPVDVASLFDATPSDKHLWFFDLLCPFSSPLVMYRTLKQRLSGYDKAFIVPQAQAFTVRRAW